MRLKIKEMYEQMLMALAKDRGINIPDNIQIKIKKELC
jgi:hypothetical protein